MPLKLENKAKIKSREAINSKVDISKDKPDLSKKIITFILFVMATLLTLCSLYMVGITAFERSATKGEAIIIAGVAICVALSAHLLPALVKGRQSIHIYSLISIVWLTCVSATLYSHTLFFVTTQNEKADIRSENSPEIKNIQDLIAQKEKWISEQKSRSLNDINISIANETIKIEQLIPRDCDSCKTIKSKISSYQARKSAFEDEKKIAENIEQEKNKVMQMQEEIMNKKDDKRTDAVFEKMSKVFPGISYEAFNLSSSITNALLLEILATLFWWLLSPNKKEKDKKTDKNSLIKKFIPNKREDKISLNNQPEVVHAEIINEEDTLLLGSDISNIQNKNLIDFKKSIFDNYKEMGSYVLFENDIYEVVYEDLFLQNVTLFIRKNEIVELEKPFYNYMDRFKVEDMTIFKYVHKIFKNEQREESFFKHRYVTSIVKNVIREEAPNYDFKKFNNLKENDKIEPQYNVEEVLPLKENNEKTNKFFDLNMEDLISGETKDLASIETNDKNNEIIPYLENEKEDYNEIRNDNITLENKNDGLNEDYKNILNINDFEDKNDSFFKFDIKKPLVGKYEFIKKEKPIKSKDKMNASNYIDQFLGLKNQNINSFEDKGMKKKVAGTIMDEVFPQKNNKIEIVHNEDVKNEFIDEKQVDFINNIDSILDTLEMEDKKAS